MKSVLKLQFDSVAALLLVLGGLLLMPCSGVAQNKGDAAKIVGDWKATLNADGTKLELALHIFSDQNGNVSATVDSVDQGDYAHPTSTATFQNPKLSFTIDEFHVKYEGALSANGTEIDGNLTQDRTFALNWTRMPAGSGAFSAVVGRLSYLNSLPDGAWKWHVDDMAHGEAVDLDESGWKTVAPGEKEPTDAVWYRQTYTVPQTLKGYDLTGAKIWFQFHAESGAPMEHIIYFNGRRVAMGWDLEPIVLVDHAKPGEKVTVAVKLLHTKGEKTLGGATLRIESAESRPSPDDLRQEILSASILIPSLAEHDAPEMAALNEAVRTVDVAALDAQDQAKFDASLKAAHAKLESVRPLLQKSTFTVVGQSHIDAAWLWPWTDTVDVVRRTFGTSLQLMHEYPDYKYTQSAAAYNEWMADKYPEMNAEIKQRIKEGRWEIVGGMWVEPDLNLPDGESLVRQLLVGKRWFKQAYGVDVRVGWNPDSFGFSRQLPQIYKKSGVDYFLTTKMGWNDTNHLPFSLFWWKSPDGSKVLTYFPGGLSGDLSPVRMSHVLAEMRQNAIGDKNIMDIYGVGDHGGGPTRVMIDEGNHWAQPGHVAPKYEFGLAEPFLTKLEKEIAPESPEWNYQSIAKGYKSPDAVTGKVAIPTWDSELYLEFHRGVFTTQAGLKHNLRTGEEQVLNAEKWASLAWLDGKSYPGAEITEDWKKVLFNEFHDLAAGSGIAVIYKEAQKDFDVVRQSTNEISSGSLSAVAEHIDTQGKQAGAVPVVVFNPLGWTRSGAVMVKVQLPSANFSGIRVEDASTGKTEGSALVSLDKQTGVIEVRIFAHDVPAMGYKVYQVSGEASAASTHGAEAHDEANQVKLENANVAVTVDKKSGCIVSLVDKHSKFESIAKGACGNELQAFKDTPKEYDAWNIDPGTLDAEPTRIKADSVELVNKDTAEPGIKIVRNWQSSKFVQTITIPPDADIVDVDNEIDWHETHVLIKTAFPLAASGPFATYEIPYGTIDRPTTRKNSWEKAQFEVPAIRWADLGDGKHGLSLLNQDKYGYDAAGNVLRLSLLRSPIDPDAEADRGHHHFHYALYPHAGTWKEAQTMRRGWEYDYQLTAMATTAHAGPLAATHSFAAVTPENVALTAVKKAEDEKGLIFRGYEWAGKEATAEFHVPAGAKTATVTNLMETAEGSPLTVEGDVVKVPIHPYEILSIRVDYPEGGARDK